MMRRCFEETIVDFPLWGKKETSNVDGSVELFVGNTDPGESWNSPLRRRTALMGRVGRSSEFLDGFVSKRRMRRFSHESWYCGMIACKFPDWIMTLNSTYFIPVLWTKNSGHSYFHPIKKHNTKMIILRWFIWKSLLNDDGYFSGELFWRPRWIGWEMMLSGDDCWDCDEREDSSKQNMTSRTTRWKETTVPWIIHMLQLHISRFLLLLLLQNYWGFDMEMQLVHAVDTSISLRNLHLHLFAL